MSDYIEIRSIAYIKLYNSLVR